MPKCLCIDSVVYYSLMQDAQNKLKASGGLGAFPIRKATMPRKMSDMPMKGLSSRALGSSSFNRNPRVPQPNRYDIEI